MQSTDIPVAFPIPFASNAGAGYIRAIPTAHQTASTTDAPASLHDGFPPETFTPLGSGGIPPAGEDFNGLFNQITAWNRWHKTGGGVPFDAAFSTAVGGYPKGCVLPSTTLGIFWQSAVENNTTNPDSGPSANWLKLAPAVSPAGGPGTGYRISADGFIQQWGVVAIGAGTNIYATSFNFPIPFTSEVHGPWGNANNGANPLWHPVTVMFPPSSNPLVSTGMIADTGNDSQAFAAGRYVRWHAEGY